MTQQSDGSEKKGPPIRLLFDATKTEIDEGPVGAFEPTDPRLKRIQEIRVQRARWDGSPRHRPVFLPDVRVGNVRDACDKEIAEIEADIKKHPNPKDSELELAKYPFVPLVPR